MLLILGSSIFNSCFSAGIKLNKLVILRLVKVMRKLPEAAAAKRYKRQSILIALQERFPFGVKLPPEEPRVLHCDCIEDAVLALSDLYSPEDVRFALKDFFRTPAYLKSICKKKWFRNLHGHKIELIGQDIKDRSKKRLEDIDKQDALIKAPAIIYK